MNTQSESYSTLKPSDCDSQVSLQCVTVCCSLLQCVAVCCSVLQCVTVCCSVLQCVAVCCKSVASVLQCVPVCCISVTVGRNSRFGRRASHGRLSLTNHSQPTRNPLATHSTHCNTLQHAATRCNTLQHTAKNCNTLQHTATHCNTPHISESWRRYESIVSPISMSHYSSVTESWHTHMHPGECERLLMNNALGFTSTMCEYAATHYNIL